MFLLLMDVLTEDVRKDEPVSMMFTDDTVLCGDDETDMTVFDRVLGDLEESIRGQRVSIPKTQFIDVTFGQDNGQGTRKRAG